MGILFNKLITIKLIAFASYFYILTISLKDLKAKEEPAFCFCSIPWIKTGYIIK